MQSTPRDALLLARDQCLSLRDRIEACIALALYFEWHEVRTHRPVGWERYLPESWFDRFLTTTEIAEYVDALCDTVQLEMRPFSALLFAIRKSGLDHRKRALTKLIRSDFQDMDEWTQREFVLLIEDTAAFLPPLIKSKCVNSLRAIETGAPEDLAKLCVETLRLITGTGSSPS